MAKIANRNLKVAGAVGVGLAALTAAAVGAYFLFGKEGKKRRNKVKSWMLKARGEVLEQLENLQELNQAAYNRVIDEVASNYKKLKHIDPLEVAQMVGELKSHWKSIHKQFAKPTSRRKQTKRGGSAKRRKS